MIELSWTWALSVLWVLLAILAGLGQWHYKTKKREASRKHWDELNALSAQHSKALEEKHDTYLKGIRHLQAQCQDFVNKAGQAYQSMTAQRDILLRVAVPAVYRVASLQEATENGDKAARWLYTTHLLGHWVPVGKDEARVLARGAMLVKMNPQDMDKIIASFRPPQEVMEEQLAAAVDEAEALGEGRQEGTYKGPDTNGCGQPGEIPAEANPA